MKRVVSRGSFATEEMHRDAKYAFTHNYLKSPRGQMILSLFGKLFAMDNVEPEQVWDLLIENKPIDEVREMIYRSPRLKQQERFILFEAINKFLIHYYRNRLDTLKSKRADHVNYRLHDVGDPNLLDYPDMGTLDLPRKKRVKKAKSKRKPVKKCRCK